LVRLGSATDILKVDHFLNARATKDMMAATYPHKRKAKAFNQVDNIYEMMFCKCP
jgi:hypothetical protein